MCWDAELFNLCRALCEEDVQGASSSVRDAAGEEGQAIMPQSAMKESGLSSSDAYLTRKAGQLSVPCRYTGSLSQCVTDNCSNGPLRRSDELALCRYVL